uniref:Protein kinase domain-containing protein n=1 Tax=Maylandia zebra TaxID=106582 RepID=A0A3P9DKD2_9CICH
MTFTSNHLEICKGTLLGGHYKVEGFLEEGGFGIVTKCCNTKTNKVVAIKVNKSDPEILQQAKMEILILEQLRGLDADRCNIVQWNDFFIDGDCICLNFELLDQCLWDYIEDRENHCLPISEIRPILHQLTNALSHLGSVGIVHADLKPGNIMVVDRYECPIKVKLIDFGLACPASTVIPGDCVGTVGYEAPEVMIDHVLDSGLYTDNYFIKDNYNGQHYQSNDTRSIKLKCLDDLGLLLTLDPNQRITPSEVLHHPFFNPGLSKSSPCTDMILASLRVLPDMSSKRGPNLVVSQQPSKQKDHRESISSIASTTDKNDKNTNRDCKKPLTADYIARIN